MRRGACGRPAEVRTTRGLYQGRAQAMWTWLSVVKGRRWPGAGIGRDGTRRHARYLAEQAMRASGG